MYLCLASGFGSYSKSSQGIHTDNVPVHSKIKQAVQPAHTFVGLGCPEILALLQIRLVKPCQTPPSLLQGRCPSFRKTRDSPSDTFGNTWVAVGRCGIYFFGMFSSTAPFPIRPFAGRVVGWILLMVIWFFNISALTTPCDFSIPSYASEIDRRYSCKRLFSLTDFISFFLPFPVFWVAIDSVLTAVCFRQWLCGRGCLSFRPPLLGFD